MLLLPVVLASALAAGIASALVAPPFPPQPPLLVLALSTLLAAAGLWRRDGRVVLAAAAGGVMCAGAALGADAEARARRPPLAAALDLLAPDGAVTVSGVLVEDAAPAAGGVRLRVALGALGGRIVDEGGLAALTVAGALAGPEHAAWRAGRAVRLPATLRRPAWYLNPGVPDDRLALARRGLVLVGSVKSGALVEVVAPGAWHQERAAAVRAGVRAALAARVATRDPGAAAIATAILIGDRAGLDPEVEDRLQAAGTYHVIAISGGNIAVLTALLLGAARLLRVQPQFSGPVVALLLVAHAGLVGGGASVTRATSMAVIYLGLRALDQSAWSLNALAAAAAGLLLAQPLALVDAGFLLSAGATAAIVVLAARLAAAGPASGLPRAALGIVAASVATEIVLLPVSAAFFNRVTVAGLVLNLAAVPLMAVVQIASMAVVALDAAAPGLADAAGLVVAVAARGLVASAHLVEWWPWLAMRTPAPAWWAAIGYAATLAVLVAWPHVPGAVRRRRARACAVALAVTLAAWIVTAPSTWRWPWRADGWLRVVALDVGQGDATLIEFPDGRRWLVDAGGLPGSRTYDIGERVVAPTLWARGTGRLDRLVLTHGDPDHVGGAASVVDDFGPTVLEGVLVPGHATLAALRARAEARRRSWERIEAGAAWVVGGVTVRAWHPPPPDWERQRVRNDDSVVLELRYGGVSIVLPGDIGAEVERALAARIPPAPRRVLKAAHHGSATSTSDAWLDALRPEVVVISCGRENRYGHPAGSVLGRLRDRGIQTLRTDQDGQVVVETDGNEVRLSTFSDSRLGGPAQGTVAKARGREAANGVR